MKNKFQLNIIKRKNNEKYYSKKKRKVFYAIDFFFEYFKILFKFFHL